jgi:MFS family permease
MVPTLSSPEAIKTPPVERSVGALAWLFFFLADIQTGVGPFLAAYLAASGWDPGATGIALTAAGLVTVCLSPAAGAWVDASRRKRLLIALGTGAVAAGALLLVFGTHIANVGAAQVLIGAAGAILGPAMAALTLGIVGRQRFDRQFGKNQAFNSAGNVFTALVLAAASVRFGLRSIFIVTALFSVPVWLTLTRIDPRAINDAEASASSSESQSAAPLMTRFAHLCADRTLVIFLVCSFLFHLANAAMLPQLGELLAHGQKKVAAPFMSACIIVTQVVIAATATFVGKAASRVGRKPLLLLGFGVLPVRGGLYALTHFAPALIAIQVFDGIANSIFAVVSILVVADRMRGTGHFNLAQGALATCVGLGAALSNTLGGLLVRQFSFNASFLGLGGIAALAWCLVFVALPETLQPKHKPC